MMYKVLLITALFGLAVSLPRRGLDYTPPESHPDQLKMANHPLMQLSSLWSSWFPSIKVRTAGEMQRDDMSNGEDLTTYTRVDVDWAGADVFADLYTADDPEVEVAGVGLSLGNLLKIYFADDLLRKNNTLLWDANF